VLIFLGLFFFFADPYKTLGGFCAGSAPNFLRGNLSVPMANESLTSAPRGEKRGQSRRSIGILGRAPKPTPKKRRHSGFAFTGRAVSGPAFVFNPAMPDKKLKGLNTTPHGPIFLAPACNLIGGRQGNFGFRFPKPGLGPFANAARNFEGKKARIFRAIATKPIAGPGNRPNALC